MSSATNEPRYLTALSRFARRAWMLLAVYWIALIIGTHLPPQTLTAPDVEISDKTIHLLAYCGLSFLAAVVWRSRFGKFKLLAGIGLLVGLSAFAAIDEYTQSYVGRSCDFGDWVFDVIGVAIGLVVFRALLTIYDTWQARLAAC